MNIKERSSLIRLSQGHLNLLATCPPKFQQIYLEQLHSLPNPEQQEKLIWGTRFHLLMQQRELGLPLEALLAAEPELHHSLTALVQAAPDILIPTNKDNRQAEHCRTLNFNNYLLTVIYDLLILDESQGKILDWKTYLKPQKKKNLADNWQTRLYLYVLTETSNYLPEQISFTYWFVKLPQQPQSLTFTYSSQQHQQTRQDLADLLSQLDKWLNDYHNHEITFPHRANCETTCPYYQFLISNQESQSQINKTITEIEEISI